jgi:DNA polymerase III subunit epsilon
VPSCPGVYVVEDADGAPLYVGKAVDLRRRLAAYVGRAFALHRQLDGLAVRAAGVRTEPCASDLEARLLEARLVRRLRPPFNVQRRARPSAGLLRVAPNDRAPSVRAVRAAAPDGALYFGPYRSARAARAHLELARAAFPDAFGRARPDLPARRAAVQAVGRLLSGQAGEALAALRERMARRGAAGDHLGVDRLRRAIRDVLALEPCPSPLLGISPAEGLLVLDPLRDGAGVRAHLLRDGHLVASGTVRADVRGADLAALAADLARDAEPPDDPDDAAIVLRWLSEPTEGRTIVPLRRLG